MTERMKKAVDNHHNGYNCSQAIVCAFADVLDMDEKDLFRMAEAFGFGMGSMGTCGSLSSMALIVGLLESDGKLRESRSKKTSYRVMKQLTKALEEKNGALICRELRGRDTGVMIRSCDDRIRDAVGLLEKYLSEWGKVKE